MDLSKTITDAELLRRMMAGDEASFTTLYRRRQGELYRFALQMSGSKTIAEDVTQEVFMALMRGTHHYDSGKGTLTAYLYGIARNQVLRHLEHNRLYVPIADETEDGVPAAGKLIVHCEMLNDLARDEMIEQLHRAILALPAHYREAIVLCDLQELSYVEAATVLDCAVGTVRSRLHRARVMLIEKLRATNETGHAVKIARCFA